MTSILIVDDSRTSRRVLRNILEDINLTVVGEARNGEEGYQMYKELMPDIVTLDITMPVLDGIGTLEKIKSEYPNAKIIMVTAASQRSKIIEAIRLGATEFVPKPFEAVTIVNAIEKVLREPSNADAGEN